ncbi:probable polygalacturonase At3g15720 [Rutidosis leptorrhynchoides]|uniref:probable polygalacturonase At3g15720 n=1 Tax=Rutidosis leptorrhynchoides TaxID=125765 RepID=UPI003A99BB5F
MAEGNTDNQGNLTLSEAPVQMVTLVLVLLSSMLSFALSSSVRISLASTSNIFDVMKFGAKGNGKTDDSPAFMKAWKAACQSQGNRRSILVIPRGVTFFLKPITFSGPCKPSNIYVQVSGNIVAPTKKTDWFGHYHDRWILFALVNGLTMSGNGRIDGQGPIWWKDACITPPAPGTTCHAPAALQFKRCNNLRLNGLTHLNSPRVHITITTCNGVIVSNLHIIAPETSPNTDGINVATSTNVNIRDSIIATAGLFQSCITIGDDCIAISGGSSNIKISGIMCGPGHGISIGSLGGTDVVENVDVKNCTMRKTLTGVRIKTWQGGSGYARKISFAGIKFDAVYNPIIIDQNYCPTQENCLFSSDEFIDIFLYVGFSNTKTSAVKLSDITYRGISGTSMMENVINLSCSKTVACTNIVMDRVYIKSAIQGRTVYGSCTNAHGRASHVKPSFNCLKP